MLDIFHLENTHKYKQNENKRQCDREKSGDKNNIYTLESYPKMLTFSL